MTGIGQPDLMRRLGQSSPRLLCSLVHKFGLDARGRGDAEFESFLKEIEAQPGSVVGEVFVFVDECHRTQSGRLNRAMQATMNELPLRHEEWTY
jgi:type I restriction enzyme R subunit